MVRVKATSEKDLKVLAYLIQDAILPIGDFAYFPEDKKVMFAMNRFCWEDEKAKIRSNSILSIYNVNCMKIQNINILNRAQKLYILDMYIDGEFLYIVFSSNKKIKIGFSELWMTLRDTGETWPTDIIPKHN